MIVIWLQINTDTHKHSWETVVPTIDWENQLSTGGRVTKAKIKIVLCTERTGRHLSVVCWSPVIHQCGVFISYFSFLLEALFPVFQSQRVIMPSDYNAESLPAVWNQNTGKNTKWRKGEGNRGVERKGKERNFTKV